MVDDFITLGFLVLLQAVLGFDNLLYISLESKRVVKEKRDMVRKLGIGLAVALRIVLLIALLSLIEYVQDPLFTVDVDGVIEGAFTVHVLIVLLGGVFILYTAVKEIWHMVVFDEEQEGHTMEKETKSAQSVITMIVVMNLVFSFDSILSAMALTKTLWVLITAIVIGGLLMIGLVNQVSDFLEKNRMYEVLGLFILFIVGIMLLSEGGHLAELYLFGAEITKMSKATFYFVIAVLVVIDIVQGRYKKKLVLEQKTKRSLAKQAQKEAETASKAKLEAASKA